VKAVLKLLQSGWEKTRRLCVVFPRTFEDEGARNFIIARRISVMKHKALSTRALTAQAMLAAIAIFLVYVNFPIFAPPFDFLRIDFADIPVLLATAMFGIPAGLSVLFVASFIQSLLPGGAFPWGLVMHLISSGVLVIAWSLVYRIRKNWLTGLLGAVAATICVTLVMIPVNLIVTPIYTGYPVEAIREILLPILIPFNCINAGTNILVVPLLLSLRKPMERFLR